MASEHETTIGIGKTDGFRYVAVKPPLNSSEWLDLIRRGVVKRGQFEAVDIPPACTMIQLGEFELLRGVPDEIVTKLADDVSKALSQTRSEITMQPGIVRLIGYQSSPFNPNTDDHSQG